MIALSHEKVDQLGDRLRQDLTEDDLRLLDSYRRSFSAGYEGVNATIRGRLKYALKSPLTGRPAKSTTSIIEKLQRETTRLSQVQDIAGCRLLVSDVRTQNRVVSRLRKVFSRVKVVDRRRSSSHGYRAVHVIVTVDAKPIEIQIRTVLQHAWAELSEKLADVIDPGIKYGTGPKETLATLSEYSDLVKRAEHLEVGTLALAEREEIASVREEIRQLMEKMTIRLGRRSTDAVPN